ncbi:hypothetical protein FQA39_LY15824 [Lamprigera yunnana]|nr:hypothetical protein FQA39_LY15824 [Lamprigera yunnana]
MSCLLYIVVFLCLAVAPGATKFCGLNPPVSSSNVIFYLYTRLNPNGELLTNDTLTNLSDSRKTIFIIHGWMKDSIDGWIFEMKDNYLEFADLDIIAVDWREYANCGYVAAANSVPEVGRITGDFICTLVESNKAYLNDTQLNGFSLGAHVAGYAGQQVQLKNGGQKIGRINGLDAASPGFTGTPRNSRLDSNDANFVQGFHTSYLGMYDTYGVVDVYFNTDLLTCGTDQPGCLIDPSAPAEDFSLLSIIPCHHTRAVTYFISTIENLLPNLIAVKCDCVSFTLGVCDGTKIIVGEHLPSTTAPGKYFLNTACSAPFGLGENGTEGGIANYLCKS